MISRVLERLRRNLTGGEPPSADLEPLQLALGRIEARQLAARFPGTPDLGACEFKVFSQWGEDGIIQALLRVIEVPNRTFVEFGVHDYREANTRFLLQNDYWAGLVLDSDPACVERIRRDPLSWRHSLRAACHFVTAETIDGILGAAGLSGDIGLLSIDIDGNDYWVWRSISCIRPRIVICEYNSLLGPDAALTIPYDPAFERTRAHSSGLYYGASVRALTELAREKGYVLVAGNRAGNNLFFTREDVTPPDLPRLSPGQAWARRCFRDSRDPSGALTFLDFEAARRVIGPLEMYDLERRALVRVSEALARHE